MFMSRARAAGTRWCWRPPRARCTGRRKSSGRVALVRLLPGVANDTEAIGVDHYAPGSLAVMVDLGQPAIPARVSNAMLEAKNTRIQWVRKMACGFRNRERFRLAILFHLGGLDLMPTSLRNSAFSPT